MDDYRFQRNIYIAGLICIPVFMLLGYLLR